MKDLQTLWCIISLGLVLILAGCTTPVTVKTKVDPGADFGVLKSYSWFVPEKGAGDDERVRNPRVDSMVRAAADKVLQQKGYVQQAGDGADFRITWFGAIEERVRQESLEHFYDSYGYGPVVKTIPGDSVTKGQKTVYEEGTILLDILDPGNHKVIWRGSGAARLVKGMSDSEASLYIERMVGEILADFPPDAR